MIKNKYVAFCILLVLFFALWQLLDFLYTTFITRIGNQFSPIIDLVVPLAVAITVGWLLFLRNKKK